MGLVVVEVQSPPPPQLLPGQTGLLPRLSPLSRPPPPSQLGATDHHHHQACDRQDHHHRPSLGRLDHHHHQACDRQDYHHLRHNCQDHNPPGGSRTSCQLLSLERLDQLCCSRTCCLDLCCPRQQLLSYLCCSSCHIHWRCQQQQARCCPARWSCCSRRSGLNDGPRAFNIS